MVFFRCGENWEDLGWEGWAVPAGRPWAQLLPEAALLFQALLPDPLAGVSVNLVSGPLAQRAMTLGFSPVLFHLLNKDEHGYHLTGQNTQYPSSFVKEVA